MSLDTLWWLAWRWYGDRLQPGWRRQTLSESQSIFQELGLTAPFWNFAS